MTDPITASNIVAQAFLHMELAPLSSIDEDTPQAADARRTYPEALRMCLEQSDWSFASTLVNLAEAEALDPPLAVDAEHPHAYVLPGDLVALREVGDSFTRWRLDRGILRASVPQPLRLRYTAFVASEAGMTATFRTAIALQLALLMGPRWLTTQTKRDQIAGELREVLARANRNDARNASPQGWGGQSGDWVTGAIL
jgi:hypothetical protein